MNNVTFYGKYSNLDKASFKIAVIDDNRISSSSATRQPL